MNSHITEMFISSIGNKNTKGFKAYYEQNDKTVITPEYSLPILKLYMEEFEEQYPKAKFLHIVDQETGENRNKKII